MQTCALDPEVPVQDPDPAANAVAPDEEKQDDSIDDSSMDTSSESVSSSEREDGIPHNQPDEPLQMISIKKQAYSKNVYYEIRADGKKVQISNPEAVDCTSENCLRFSANNHARIQADEER